MRSRVSRQFAVGYNCEIPAGGGITEPAENNFRCETPSGCCDRHLSEAVINDSSPSGLSSRALTVPMHNVGSMPLQHSARLICMQKQILQRSLPEAIAPFSL